ncbi:hypothetical protein M413DRAFT_445466 [Hebeloma cylindrosporum]|uniref:Protein kinase domain-containing protein n=1 Tax=Hebeloma cylindrosporum TaxID=76867 RepID=A0A0C2XUX2_HEBCY|nr:hypothetical protein M413DRAFT_445466 [Hebeloma cylindrosporum h7]
MLAIPLASNAISSLVVKRFVKDQNKEHINVTFHRRIPDVVKGVRTLKRSVLPDGPPCRLPSTLPPPGNLQLSLFVEELIGDGRCGTVFSTHPDLLLDLSNKSVEVLEPGLPYLPSLVIKVADHAHVEDLAAEASIYEEMENLQGVAIPRYYGWFEAELEPTWTVDFNPSKTETAPSTAPGRLSLLLLERMGPLLPIGERLSDRSDIWAIFSDLAQLGIEQPDMRYSNILVAPLAASPTTLPGNTCPYHNCVHKYRIIDFDRARKVDWTLKQHYYEQVGTLGRLLEMMEMNVILEPWEY